MGIIDGTIILIYKPDGENYILAEFYNSRKGYYGINCMIICDHRKRIIFCDSRWPGATNDKGAIARSKFLSNLVTTRHEGLFPLPFMFLADNGFFERECFMSPSMARDSREHRCFNYYVSRGLMLNALRIWKQDSKCRSWSMMSLEEML